MPLPSPTVMLVAGGVFVASVTGAYFFGRHDGWNAALAEQAGVLKTALEDFEKRVGDSIDLQTKRAVAEFKARTQILETISANLEKSQGVINAASAKLSASLRNGTCVLSPAQRRLLECVRRPDTAGCSASPPPL